MFEAKRTKLIFAVVCKAGGMQITPEFKDLSLLWPPVQAHNGPRFCRSGREDISKWFSCLKLVILIY